MSKFKVGDKVVRKAHKNNSSFKSYMGDFAYYVITDITTSGHWLRLAHDLRRMAMSVKREQK